MHDVQIIYCSKIRGSVVTLPSGLSLVLDLTPGVLLSYPDLPLQISNLCIKKMSIKINPSKKDPHNETKGSVSWKDFDGQQHDKIHSPGSTSQRSLLRSVIKNGFPGSDFAAWANLLQVQSIRNSRPLLINKQARAIQRICNDVPAGKVQEMTANFSGSRIWGGKSIVYNGIFERNYFFYTKSSSLQN